MKFHQVILELSRKRKNPDGDPDGNPDGHPDGRTTRKHNASGTFGTEAYKNIIPNFKEIKYSGYKLLTKGMDQKQMGTSYRHVTTKTIKHAHMGNLAEKKSH